MRSTFLAPLAVDIQAYVAVGVIGSYPEPGTRERGGMTDNIFCQPPIAKELKKSVGKFFIPLHNNIIPRFYQKSFFTACAKLKKIFLN